MATTTKHDGLHDLIAQLEDTARRAGERLSDYLEDVDVRRPLAEAADAIDEARLAVIRRLRDESSTKPLEDMTLRELHELATERDVPGRSSMSKAELIDALREA